MMQRALSKENLADFAHQAVSSLRKLMSSSNFLEAVAPSQLDLISTTKQIDDSWHKKQAKVDLSVVELWARSFAEELDGYIVSGAHHLQTHSPSMSSSELSTPSSPRSAAAATAAPLPGTAGSLPSSAPATRKPVSDAVLQQAVECLRIVSRTVGYAAMEVLHATKLTERLLKVYQLQLLPRKVMDSLHQVLIDALGESCGALRDSLPTFVAMLQTKDSDERTSPAHLRVLLLLLAVVRRCDVTEGSFRSGGAERDLMMILLSNVREYAAMFDLEIHKAARITTAAVLTFSALAAIVRGSDELKAKYWAQKDAKRLWVFVASNVSKLEILVNSAVSLPSGKVEERPLTIDQPMVWAAEIAEFLVEFCTTDSFSIRRQSMYGDPSAPQTPIRASTLTARGPTAAAAGVPPAARRWEPLPTNWDATLTSGSSFVWRLTSQLSAVHFSVSTVHALFSCLAHLDTATNSTSEFILRCVVSSFLMLCHAAPRNLAILAEASVLEVLTDMLTDPRSTVFPQRTSKRLWSDDNDDSSTDAPLRFSENSRQRLLDCISMIVSMQLIPQDLSKIMCAVETMRTRATTQEDCEVIEHVLNTVGATTYAPKGTLFVGGEAVVTCPVDKFVGRWYGYTFLAWVRPMCVWSDGGSLYSYADPTGTSAVVVSIVANGKAKSLAVRTSSGKDCTIALLPDTTLHPDGWSHIAIVHNIGGFNVYVNGKKSSHNTSVPFPKEPPKPHKLHFGLASDCSGALTSEAPSAVRSRDTAGGAQAPQVAICVPSLFGHTAGMEILDGALGEKDIERLAAGRPMPSVCLDPPHTLPVLLSFVNNKSEIEIQGSIAKKEHSIISGAVACDCPDVPAAFTSLGVVAWATDVLKSINDACTNRNAVAVLCLDFISVAFKLACRDELDKYHEMSVCEDLRKVFMLWSAVPPEVTNGLLSITVPQGTVKEMRVHATTSRILATVIELLRRSAEPTPAFFSCTLKDMSELFSLPENAKLFLEDGTRFVALLHVSPRLTPDSIDDFVALIEKLCKEQNELEQLLRFLAFHETTRHLEVVKCEILRMLFDIARPNTSLCDLLYGAFGGNGIWWLMYLVDGYKHRSEYVRIYATKLLALVLHCSKRAKEAFLKSNGFDLCAAAVGSLSLLSQIDATDAKRSSALCEAAVAQQSLSPAYPTGPLVRLNTYNCFFKFALDFYTSNNQLAHSPATPSIAGGGGNRHADPRSSGGGAPFGFHGHLPGVLPVRAGRRGTSFDLGYGSDCGDVEIRLSVDDNYSAQTVSKDLLVYPQGVQVTLVLLGRAVRQFVADVSPSMPASEEPSRDGLSEEHTSVTTVSNSRGLDEQMDTITKVLAYLDRIVDMTPNASVLVPHPWLDWLWGAVEPLMLCRWEDQPAPTPLRQLRSAVDASVRSIIRKVCVVDLIRSSRGTIARRIKEIVDETLLQQLVVEEIVRHFSTNNRLDTMDPAEATNCIRNLDALLQGVDEVIAPFPNGLAVEIAFAIRGIAVNNNSWVRLKMKSSTKLFEVRDRLAFSLMTSIKNFSKETSEFLQQLIDINAQDPNTMVVLLKNIVDAVQARNLEETETLQGMLRMLYSTEDEQRKVLQRVLDADAVEFLQVRGQTTVTGETPLQDLISWAMTNEGRWDAVMQKITKAYKPVETEVRQLTERREKEHASRSRARKVELEKRVLVLSKHQQDLEKLRADIEAKGLQQYHEQAHDLETPAAATGST